MPRYEPFDWYETPLYYDIIFDADTDHEADFLVSAHERFGRSGGERVLEPACGSGRLLSALADYGFGVTGFDLSEPMLEFARQRLAADGHRGTLKQTRMESFRFRQKFDLAHCLVSTFKYLLTEAEAVSHLRCMADALKPGGVYVLGLHLTDYAVTKRNRERWVAQRDGVHVTCNIQGWPADRKSRTEQVRSRLVVEREGETKRYETCWTFRTYDLKQLKQLLAAEPRLEHVATYDFNYDIDDPVPFDGRYADNLLILRRIG